MNKTFYGFAMAAMLVLAPAVQAATEIVNVDGVLNIFYTTANPLGTTVDVTLAAGTYELSFVDTLTTPDAGYTAFTRFNTPATGCNVDGQSCEKGWENSVKYIIGDNTFSFGDRDANGGAGAQGITYFETAALSFANTLNSTQQFTLNAETIVKFFIYDNNTGDNSGGVSLSVAAVPLPAAAWLFGSALLGLVAVARRRVAA